MLGNPSRPALFAAALFCGSLVAASPPSLAADPRAEARVGDRERERARRECIRMAERRGFEVRGTTPPRVVADDKVSLRIDLRRRGGRWLGTCIFDTRDRQAELDTSRVAGGRPGQGSGSGGYASSQQVRDKCVQEVSGNARTQLVSTGRIERRGDGVSVMDMVINVEGQERRVKCFFDHRTRAANIR